MYKGKKLFVVLSAALLFGAALYPQAIVGASQLHGTTDQIITEDMLSLTPPADYSINKEMQADAKEGKYNEFFLKESIQTVSIQMDENNLNYLFQNAIDKPSVMTESVTIGDKTIGYTGLKTKGNYTLEHTVTDNAYSDRFSFTINFGKYIKKAQYGEKQNFYGCDKISFNNFFFDKSMMKEYISLMLMTEMGVPTPQYGLAKLYINDEYYGVYFMVEAMESTILEQYYQVKKKELSPYLVKPEGTALLYDVLAVDDSPLWENDEETRTDVADMLPTVMEWARRLNALSQGKDFEGQEIEINSGKYIELLEQIMDVDEAVRYFAVHSFLCQMDDMFVEQHNYGLYVDTEGKCLLIPWDYDLSFGCYYPSDAESTANFDLDMMYKGVSVPGSGQADAANAAYYEKYPLFHVIYQNEELMGKYHNYMKECAKIAALGGTVSTGRTYQPGYFYQRIKTITEELCNAAGEELADHVYYLNLADQPRDVKAALPNLSRMIALRSVGVYVQVEGIDTWVAGGICDLSTLGNALRGHASTTGLLTSVDYKTGIFATAEYAAGASRSGSPMLIVDILETTDKKYLEIMEALGCRKTSDLLVYSIKDAGTPEGDYEIAIPLAAKDEVSFYSYDGKTLTELSMQQDDNLYVGAAQTIRYIAILQKGIADNDRQQGAAQSNAFAGDMAVSPVAAVAVTAVVIAAGIGICMFLRRMKQKKHKT